MRYGAADTSLHTLCVDSEASFIFCVLYAGAAECGVDYHHHQGVMGTHPIPGYADGNTILCMVSTLRIIWKQLLSKRAYNSFYNAAVLAAMEEKSI